MTPERLAECLRLVRWHKDVLAEALDVPSALVAGWLGGWAMMAVAAERTSP